MQALERDYILKRANERASSSESCIERYNLQRRQRRIRQILSYSPFIHFFFIYIQIYTFFTYNYILKILIVILNLILYIYSLFVTSRYIITMQIFSIQEIFCSLQFEILVFVTQKRSVNFLVTFKLVFVPHSEVSFGKKEAILVFSKF